MEPLIPKNKQNQTATKNEASQTDFRPLSKASLASVHSPSVSKGQTDSENGPKVETVKVDGVVKSIQVTCSCGEVIVIDCQYTD